MLSLKTLFKTSIIYGIGSTVTRAMTFLLLPFYTNELENYGEFILVMTTIGFLRICYSHGMGDGFLKLYSTSDEKKKITATYLTYIMMVILVVSSLFVVINWLSGIQNSDTLIGLLQNKLLFIMLIVFFDTLNYRIVDILRIQNRPAYYMSSQIVSVIMTFSLTIYFINEFNYGYVPYIKDEVEAALMAVLCGGVTMFMLFSPILIKNLNLKEFSTTHLQKMISFGMRFFPATLFFMFMELLDRYLLKLLLIAPNTNDLIGTYSVGCKLASVPMLLIGAFNLGWQPFYLNNGNNDDAIKQYQKVGNIFIISMLSISWVVAIIMPFIAQLNTPFLDNYPIIGPTFSSGIKIIPIILTSHVFYAMYIINMPAIYLCNKQNWSPVLRIFGAAINFILNLILIPYYGIYGAAIATSISYLLMFLFLFYKNQNWMPIKLAWSDIILLGSLIVSSIITILFNMNLQFYVMVLTSIYMIFLLYKHGMKNLILLFK